MPEEVAKHGIVSGGVGWGGLHEISRLFYAVEFISQGGYVRFVIAKLWCTSGLSPEANRTVAVRLTE